MHCSFFSCKEKTIFWESVYIFFFLESVFHLGKSGRVCQFFDWEYNIVFLCKSIQFLFLGNCIPFPFWKEYNIFFKEEEEPFLSRINSHSCRMLRKFTEWMNCRFSVSYWRILFFNGINLAKVKNWKDYVTMF